jgi:uncharacterized protein with FMN-binding domain
MKRSTIVTLGTLAGVAGVLGFNPDAPNMSASSTKSVKSTSAGTTTKTKAKAAATPAATTEAVVAAPATTSGTVNGKTVQTRFGPIQLSATVANGQLTSIKALKFPSNDGRSQQISNYSIPQLTDQAISAQSASIQGVSGATYTTQGYKQSLQSILDQL